VHATFNFVPLLAEQIEEYASGRFKEEWFEIAFRAAGLADPGSEAPSARARVPGEREPGQSVAAVLELQAQVRSGGAEAAFRYFSFATGATLQLLSQLAWMDEEYLADDPW
jgi:hypothetical protein